MFGETKINILYKNFQAKAKRLRTFQKDSQYGKRGLGEHSRKLPDI